MVFLFPGILFRRAFFSGKFNKHFDSGNVFERLLWNILLSLFALTCFSYLVYYINDSNIIQIQINIGFSSEEIIDTFTNLYENKFPDNFKEPDFLYSCIKFLFSLYTFSTLIGFFMNRFIFYLGLEKRFNFLRFQNSWEYLTNSNRKNNSSHNIGDIYSTKVDIKTKTGQLFTGKLHEVIFDKDGKIEAIAIQEAYKFYKLDKAKDHYKIEEISALISSKDPQIIKHSDTKTELIYRKRVKGNVFTILNNEIENISITYIKVSDFLNKFKKYLSIIVSIFLLLISILSIAYAIWDFGLINFSTSFRRIGFAILTPFFFVLLTLLAIEILNLKMLKRDWRKYLINIKDAFLILIIFTVPYIYPLLDIKFWHMVAIWAIVSVFSLTFLTKKEKANEAIRSKNDPTTE